jgi:glycine oxidase
LADVLIIGAGIVGCVVADALAHQGARVQVFDPRGVGAGATQASAGMLAPYSEGVHSATLESLGARSLALFDTLIDRLTPYLDTPAVYARTGSLEVAFDDEEAEKLRMRAADHAARGVASSFLLRSDVRQVEPEIATDCTGALLTLAHGYANARALTNGLWRAAESQGATLVAEPVERVAGSAGRMTVVTPSRTYAGETIVLAAGSWAGRVLIEGGPSVPVRPVRGQLVELRWPTPPLTRIVSGPRCYLVPWPDGTVLAGATSEDVGFDDRTTVAGVRDLLEATCELLPGAWQAAFSGVRVGFRPATPDGLPMIGRSERMPGLVYATGHFRNGVLLAPLTGELVVKAIAGADDPAFSLTAPGRFGAF